MSWEGRACALSSLGTQLERAGYEIDTEARRSSVRDLPGTVRVGARVHPRARGDFHVTPTGTWADRRACADSDPELFLPREIGRNVYREARVICAGCPVQAECLEAILLAEGSVGPRLRFGMYAGLTPKQRAAISGREQRVCCVCGRPFESLRARLTCGPACARVRKTDWSREYQRVHRYNGGPNPIPFGNKHGSISRVHKGCKCTACTGRRRQERRRRRVIIAAEKAAQQRGPA